MFKGSKYYNLTIISLMCMAASAVGMLQNVVGIFFLPISQDLNTGIASLSLSATIMSLSTGFSAPITMRYMVKNDTMKMMRVGIVVAALTTFLIAFANSLWQIYALSIIRGIATGTFGLAPIMYFIGNWFEEKQGFVTGLVMSLTGLTGVIFNPLVNFLIISLNWRLAMGFTSLFILVLTYVGTLWLHPYPKDVGEVAYGHKVAHSDSKPHEKLKIKFNFFFILLAFYATLTASLSALIQHFPNYSLTINLDSTVGALMVSFAMAGNVFFKFVLGTLSDRVGVIKSIVFISLIYTSSLVAFIFFPIESSKILLMIFAFFMGSIYSVVAVGITLLTKAFYPKEEANLVYASLTTFIAIGASGGVVVMGLIYDLFGSYLMGQIGLLSFVLLTLLLITMMKMIKKTQTEAS